MSALKARIVDLVVSGGEEGIASEAIYQRLFHDSSRETMKAHIWQINEMLADEGVRLACGKGSSIYHLQRRRRRAA